mmetsp:Transcript_10241/g.20000  ORF Transcript_10241/g.20000 Transcript_10241/m.20000 type:complete len:173 (+) Transcript_10241:26-544(+)
MALKILKLWRLLTSFRRAGAEVVLAATGSDRNLTLSQGVKILVDVLISNVLEQESDVIIVPGGTGAEKLASDANLMHALQEQKRQNKFIAGICAGTTDVLQQHGLLEGEYWTTHPCLKDKLQDQTHSAERVCVSNKVITSQGPGTCVEFAMVLIKQLIGDEKAHYVRLDVLA